jgi:HK97 family phage major capsid protein
MKTQFNNLGDFARSVRAAASGRTDSRLMAQATFGNEAVGSEGGFAVPPEFASQIMATLDGEESLMKHCHQIEVGSNRLELPADEAPAWGTSGIVAAWEGEGVTLAQQKPELKENIFNLPRLKALVPVTEALDNDSPALADWLTWRFSEAVRWKMNAAIVSGTGNGMPLGILNADSTLSVAKESGQGAGTILAANILKMYSRMLASSQARAVWVCNPDALIHLGNVTLENGAPAYLANNGQGAPGGYLMGRPVVFTEAGQAIGTRGDIVLADLRNYVVVKRRGDPNIKHSIHLWFDQSINAYRVIFRADGMPLLHSAVTPPNSSNTRSINVALETRA